MNKELIVIRWWHFLAIIAVCAIFFLAGYALKSVSCLSDNYFYQSSQYMLPNEVIYSSKSPISDILAEIVHDKSSKRYFFAIRNKNEPRLIVDSLIHPENAYHEPLFRLNWFQDGKSVQIIIDYDFGDGNLVYRYFVDEYKLIKE